MPDILVTGATKGIGAAISQRLTAAGHTVIGIARTAPDSFPGIFYGCDLSDPDATAAVIDKVRATHTVVRVVNNAGIALPQPIEELDLATLQHVMAVNTYAAVQIVAALVPGMRRQRFGRIVNIASRAIYGARGRTAYSAAKSALVGCTRTWALELASDGITVNAVAPGPISTELFHSSHPAGSDAEHDVLTAIPVGRLGTPNDVAAAVEFLLSDDAGFITGQTLGVDGGLGLGGR